MTEHLSAQDVPVQPVERPILCNPYEEPTEHWLYNRATGAAQRVTGRREAGYYFKTERTGSAQRSLFAEEQREDLPLVSLLRSDVRRWRQANYPGASVVSRELLRYWARPDRPRRLFFCQREAVETLVHLAEVRLAGKTGRLRFKPELSEDDLQRLLRGERPSFVPPERDTFPTLSEEGLRRLGCKMATGSGKTVVMAMLVAWAFCNRGHNPASREYANGVLVCCPNLTVKERLQVLRPDNPENYYAAFDLVPLKYRPLLQAGKVLVTNWHAFAPESPHVENGKSYAVVNKGPETPETFARRVLGDLADRLPVLVLNDEGHHCWRPRLAEEQLTGEERSELEAEREEATVWVEGLDRMNRANGAAPGVALCVDLSATPFYLKGSGHPEGRPFPWLVSDFGLVDAIESGIVKIPRLPVSDVTGRPDAKYFRLWETITSNLLPAERLPGRAKKPKPEVVYREAEGALQQLAGQWAERFGYVQNASPGQERVPPVLIVVCDNTDIAEVFYRKISGETEEALDGPEDEPGTEGEPGPAPRGRGKAGKKRVVCGRGAVFPEFFSNTPAEKRTIRIDTKLLAEAESADPGKARSQAAEELRRVVATVGKPGQPGEHVRCVVSVAMLTEGWDAQNVTHILGVRAFGSQLLCEQVVGRGLRRMDYTPDPATGLLTEEYVDVYGIPFSVIPYKGRPVLTEAPEDRPKNHVRALPERAGFELRFPVVEGYAFALRRNLIRCDLDTLEPLVLEPNREPTATFVRATVGYLEGGTAQAGPVRFEPQDRTAFYGDNHPQTIQFVIARLVVERLLSGDAGGPEGRRRQFRLRSRHELFPQVYRLVEEYVRRKVDFRGCDPSELGLEKYVRRIVERLGARIEPDPEQGEPPLLPILNRYQPSGSTAGVNFKTTRRCYPTQHSHLNQVVLDTDTWEASAAFRLENAAAVRCYARNDELGLTIPYEYQGIDHGYEPDFLLRRTDGLNVLLEIKGFEDDRDRAKHDAARRWVAAVNNWGELGQWAFHVCRDPHLLERELTRLHGG